MTHPTATFKKHPVARRSSCLLAAMLAVLGYTLLLGADTASAISKQPVDFFGGVGTRGGQFASSAGIAVNQSGAGPANQGDIYVADATSNRIQRYSRDDNGTPSQGVDDTYSFLSAWGADVDSSAPGVGYEVCTVAESCRAGLASGASGALSNPDGVAVDQDSGLVYVADRANNRISVYAGDGAFLRSFGFDVVASGPDDAGTGYEVCVAANGDVCKEGVAGSGVGQMGPVASGFRNERGIAVSQPDGNPATGTVFLADSANTGIGSYHLDGTSPASIGSGISPGAVAVDSRGIVYASVLSNKSQVVRYDSENANGGGVGFLAPIAAGVNEVQQVTVSATAGTFNLTYNGETTVDLPFNARAGGELDQETSGVIDTVLEALQALPSIGGQNLNDNREVRVNGGPGDAGGTTPYRIEFDTGLGAKDVEQIGAASGAAPLSGGAGASVTTLTAGQPGLVPTLPTSGLAVDPDSDGAGPDADTLYVQRTIGSPHVVQQFGPLTPPGLAAPPSAFDDIHGSAFGYYIGPAGLAIDELSGRLYVTASGEVGNVVYVLDEPGPHPTASLDSLSDVTASTVTAHATINPNGPPALSYHLEYSTDGIKWQAAPSIFLGSQQSPQAVSPVLNPGGGGLEPNTFYHLRLVAVRPFLTPLVSAEKTFTTLDAPPLSETTGSPVHTTTTARLDGRVAPRGSASMYHFEYGEQGPCDSNPCTTTEPHSAGSGKEFVLVSQEIEGLQPNTTYHYRVVADNGNPGSPVAGEDMTLTTFANEATLSHGHFPGPVGSDRAWEMVSAPDTSGNPVGVGFAPGATTISDAGDRAVYGVSGGTPDSEVGTIATRLFAQRTPSGWQTEQIFAPRDEATSDQWSAPGGPSDLSALVSENAPRTGFGEFSFWRLSPDDPPQELFGAPDNTTMRGGFLGVSDDASRVLVTLRGSHDPAHPVQPQSEDLYDISSAEPKLISLLPDGSIPACGVQQGPNSGGLPGGSVRASHWVTADGSRAFFPTKPCGGLPQRLYLRDFESEATKLISSPTISGRECPAYFIKSIPGAAFFYTKSRLAAEDSQSSSCVDGGSGSDGDVYRYDLEDSALECVTCMVADLNADVTFFTNAEQIGSQIGVADDGSRIYFTSLNRLLAGAPDQRGIYRLNVTSGDLAYVGSFGSIGEYGESAISPDGSVVVFDADKSSLNALGGQQNGATNQYYRYDDDDRSLICISCPADGSVPSGPVRNGLRQPAGGVNTGPLSADGGIFAFATSTPLVAADQNTGGPGQDPRVGTDIYEWREGRLLLVSDGLINWPEEETPAVQGVSPSGHDIFFTAATQYTRDALDGYSRLYDARIGGGFEFPPPPKPCPLEVCQGTPKGAPEEAAPGTATITGAGNIARSTRTTCTKPKRKVRRNGKTRCVKPAHKKHARQRANHKRRTAR